MKEEKSLMENMMYYTPELTDLRIGYECQANITVFKVKEGWIPCTLKGVGPEVIHYHSLGVYRTPYITKEQIKSEGWEPIKSVKTLTTERFINTYKKNNFILSHESFVNNIIIFEKTLKNNVEINVNSKMIRFQGECKSINELRTIEKLLKIK